MHALWSDRVMVARLRARAHLIYALFTCPYSSLLHHVDLQMAYDPDVKTHRVPFITRVAKLFACASFATTGGSFGPCSVCTRDLVTSTQSIAHTLSNTSFTRQARWSRW